MTRVAVVWLHVLAAAVWLGGLVYASHLVVPAVARGDRGAVAILARARVAAWVAVALVVLTGLENLRHARLESLWLQLKVLLVLLLVPLAAHRDFALVPRLRRALDRGVPPASAASGLRRLDPVILLLGVVALFLGVGLARGR
jgi:putative copper export protein